MRHAAIFLTVVIALFLVASTVMAVENNDSQTIKDAIKAYNEGDSQTAIKILKPLAEKGNVVAQSRLGSVYGWDNEAEALRWFTLAAKQGDTHAQINMGDMYAGGYGGLKKDCEEAMKYYTLAADQGDPDAQIEIGRMYLYSDCVNKNADEAVKWYNMAAKKDPFALHIIGDMYRMGTVMKEDKNESIKYYILAAEQGYVFDQKYLGDIYSGDDFSYGSAYKDYVKSLKWYQLAANNGYSDAQIGLAVLYRNGKGVEKDTVMAYVWYKIASNNDPSNSVVKKIVADIKTGMTDADILKADAKVKELMTTVKVFHYEFDSWRPFLK